jgi:hypothetical protein
MCALLYKTQQYLAGIKEFFFFCFKLFPAHELITVLKYCYLVFSSQQYNYKSVNSLFVSISTCVPCPESKVYNSRNYEGDERNFCLTTNTVDMTLS